MKRYLCVGDSYVLSKRKPKYTKIKYFSLLAVLSLMCLYAAKQASAQQAEPAAPAVADTTKYVRDTIAIEEVQVSTGYQRIPRERATGSFVFIDSNTFHRSVSPNILERLDGVTSSLIIHKGLPTGGNSPFMAIRGQSTIFGNPEPLIVVDGFPFEGDITQLNAADVASVSVLRDAAAASIWGTRSGNGVVVITTKQGRLNQPLRIEGGATYSVAGRPDLHYREQLSAAEYLEMERTLYDAGYYNSQIRTPYRAISQGVALYDALANGTISQAEADATLSDFSKRDIWSEMEALLYRPQQIQQYRLQLSGGGNRQSYFLSGSYNRKADHLVTENNNRGTVDAKQTIHLLGERLRISTGLNYAFSTERFGGATSAYRPYTPYDKLIGTDGQSLPVVRTFKLGYLDTVGGGQLLDWHYRPADELFPDFKRQNQQLRLQTTGTLGLLPTLDVVGAYQYFSETSRLERLTGLERYHTRNLINQYSYFEGNQLIRPIALGSISEQRASLTTGHTYRIQMQYDGNISDEHRLNILLGHEGSDYRTQSNSFTLYGYDQLTRTHANSDIDPTRQYAYYYSSSGSRINTAPSLDELVNTTRSYYGNIAYTFREQFDVSGSFRRDESNLFGVKSNQRGVPLWSTGIAWHLNKTNFYQVPWLPKLKLRFTYGYNGNVDKSLSAYLTMRLSSMMPLWGPTFGNILNPPNPGLRWEKVQTWNAGVDFSLVNDVITGSVDFYRKNGQDLIGESPIAPQTGITTFRGNNSNTRVSGVDISLQSVNFNRAFRWETHFLFSYSDQLVTKYGAGPTRNSDILRNNFSNPLEGYPYYAMFSLPSAGLNSSGDPQGYWDGQISTDYVSILFDPDANNLRFHGSTTPRFFGHMNNSFSYRGIELSINLTYKFDYYFRRTGVFSGSEFGYNYSDYKRRWREPGDEVHTYIPAFSYPANSNRATFFRYIDKLIEPGDHIRVKDVRLSWQLPARVIRGTGLRSVRCFAYATRFGTLWQQSTSDRDPDFPVVAYRDPFQFTFGLTLSL